MATSTFGKSFSVSKKSAADFTNEMIKNVSPTLPNDFKSNFTPLDNNSQVKNLLLKVLGN